MLARLREQAERYGADLVRGSVSELRREDGGFIARFDKGEIRARMVLLATGLVDAKPDTEGLREGVAHGAIRFCPICDGYEAMDQRIGVIGSLAHAGPKALFLRTYSREVILFPTQANGDRAELEKAGVAITAQPLAVAPEGDRVTVRTEDGQRHLVDRSTPRWAAPCARSLRPRSARTATTSAICAWTTTSAPMWMVSTARATSSPT